MLLNKMFTLLPVILPFGILFLVLGIIFMFVTTHGTVLEDFVVDYTNNCMELTGVDAYCHILRQTLKPDENCVCLTSFTLPNNLIGEVTVYYEFTNFDQSQPEYYNSRDPEQLLGRMSPTPSESCGEYRFINGKPVLPCGAVAESMPIRDSYKLRRISNVTTEVPTVTSGLIPEDIITAYVTPNRTFETDSEIFEKPASWNSYLWELDNGFQNTAFIAWMTTEWKRKPVFKVLPSEEYANGLPKGNYAFRIGYNYPVSRYNGTRLLILTARRYEYSHYTGLGITAMVVGAILLVVAITLIYRFKNRAPYKKDIVRVIEIEDDPKTVSPSLSPGYNRESLEVVTLDLSNVPEGSRNIEVEVLTRPRASSGGDVNPESRNIRSAHEAKKNLGEYENSRESGGINHRSKDVDANVNNTHRVSAVLEVSPLMEEEGTG